MTDSGCRNCGGTGWTSHPSLSDRGEERREPCECDRRTPPAANTWEREAVAHAIELCTTPYISEALADAALAYLAPIRAAEIAAAEAKAEARIVAWLRDDCPGCPYVAERGIANAIERREHAQEAGE